MKNPRKLDLMYSIISFFLSIIFFWAAWISISSWDFWENIPLIILAIFFLGAGIYGFNLVAKGRPEEIEDASASREIVKMAVLLVVLAIAIWIMFHFGFE